MEWNLVKEHFPDEKDFEKGRDDELKRLKERIKAIEDYQDKNSDTIKPFYSEMKKARGEYEDALSMLEDKKNESEKIRGEAPGHPFRQNICRSGNYRRALDKNIERKTHRWCGAHGN